MNQQRGILHLFLIPGIGPGIIHDLYKKSDAIAWDQIYQYNTRDWRQVGCSSIQAEKIVVGLQDTTLFDRELQLIEQHAISWCTIADDTYPESLRNIHLPPPVLYWRGTLPKDGTHCAIVGSRGANQYGKRIVDTMVPQLVVHGITIISGGALGADSMAHRATLSHRGKTIAVLGSGLLRPYPSAHRTLFEDMIAEGGAIVSSFPLQTNPHQGNFPARNRIISGLSRGVLVVQAAKKSGTRITAQYALEQGKDVFVVPGLFDDPLSEGCHMLAKEGALLITDPDDILREYGILRVNQRSEPFNLKQDSKKAVQLAIDSPEMQILSFCTVSRSLDELQITLKMESKNLQAMLFDLQISGKIMQDFTGKWQAVA